MAPRIDSLVLATRDVMGESLASRRVVLEKQILPKLHDPVRYSVELNQPARSHCLGGGAGLARRKNRYLADR